MRSFRFPRFAIVLMIACFLTISSAILLAAEISRRVGLPYFEASPNMLALWWRQLPAMVLTGSAVCGAFGVIGYGVLIVLRRTGLERLSRLDVRPIRRS
jgi:hypothetical protein